MHEVHAYAYNDLCENIVETSYNIADFLSARNASHNFKRATSLRSSRLLCFSFDLEPNPLAPRIALHASVVNLDHGQSRLPDRFKTMRTACKFATDKEKARLYAARTNVYHQSQSPFLFLSFKTSM